MSEGEELIKSLEDALIEEINKGVAMANAHFKSTGVKAKAYDVHSVVVEKVKGE